LSVFIESLALAPGLFVQASREGFRLHRLSPWTLPPTEEMPAAGEVAVTRELMAGAYYAGWPTAAPDCPEKDELLAHIFGLAAGYRTTNATPRLMSRAADRMAAEGRDREAAYCREVAKEEAGHDALALKDLEALGLPPLMFVSRLRPAPALGLAALMEELVESETPLSVLGYAYVLERGALRVTAEMIEKVERALPLGVRATRCMRVHSAVGSDTRHVAESLDFIASLPAADRAAIARAAWRTSAQIAETEDDYPGDEGMHAHLAAFGWSADRRPEPA